VEPVSPELLQRLVRSRTSGTPGDVTAEQVDPSTLYLSNMPNQPAGAPPTTTPSSSSTTVTTTPDYGKPFVTDGSTPPGDTSPTDYGKPFMKHTRTPAGRRRMILQQLAQQAATQGMAGPQMEQQVQGMMGAPNLDADTFGLGSQAFSQ